MNDWDLLAIIGAGIIIGLVAENNKGIFKRITQLSTITFPFPSSAPPVRAAPTPKVVPISTEAPPATIDLSKGKCPPGMYLDQTMGIY